MSRTAIKRRVPASSVSLLDRAAELFDRDSPTDMVGLFCLVHLDRPRPEVRRKRVEEFTPEMIFDPNCPHCAPFLKQGAYILYTPEGPFGLRLLPDRTFEMVGLTGTLPDSAKKGTRQ